MNSLWAIYRKECVSYADTVVGPVVVVDALILLGVVVFYYTDILARGVADLAPLFQWAPLILALNAPVVTMRLMAEERRSGTLELLRALPISAADLVLGKFLAGLSVLLLVIACTAPYVVTIALLGDLEAGPVVGGYVGLALVSAALVSVGLVVSSLTSSQTVAFFVAEVVILVWWAAGHYASRAPLGLARALEFCSFDARYRSLARGVIDTRDVLALVGITAVALAVAVFVVRRERLRR